MCHAAPAPQVVERANAWAALLGCQKRVHFLSTNATVSLESLLSTYTGTLARVYIQFPDPHFKRRHKKRQIFQPQLIDAITHRLPPGGERCCVWRVLIVLWRDMSPPFAVIRALGSALQLPQGCLTAMDLATTPQCFTVLPLCTRRLAVPAA